jgi:hypothetical protein
MIPIFRANDFIKKNCFFVFIDLINAIKIYEAIIAVSKIFLIRILKKLRFFFELWRFSSGFDLSEIFSKTK